MKRTVLFEHDPGEIQPYAVKLFITEATRNSWEGAGLMTILFEATKAKHQSDFRLLLPSIRHKNSDDHPLVLSKKCRTIEEATQITKNWGNSIYQQNPTTEFKLVIEYNREINRTVRFERTPLTDKKIDQLVTKIKTLAKSKKIKTTLTLYEEEFCEIELTTVSPIGTDSKVIHHWFFELARMARTFTKMILAKKPEDYYLAHNRQNQIEQMLRKNMDSPPINRRKKI